MLLVVKGFRGTEAAVHFRQVRVKPEYVDFSFEETTPFSENHPREDLSFPCLCARLARNLASHQVTAISVKRIGRETLTGARLKRLSFVDRKFLTGRPWCEERRALILSALHHSGPCLRTTLLNKTATK